MDMLKKINLSSYPRLHPKWILHVTPSYGFIHSVRPSDDQDSAVGHYREDASFIDDEGADILALCDGTKSGNEILDCVRKKHPSLGEKELLTFLSEAANRGHIVWLSHRLTRGGINITGSKDYYFPIHVSVELTSRCNLRCIYCYCGFIEHEEPLTKDELLNILSRWHELGLVGIEITGGEPLMHPHFLEILEFCSKRFYPLGILTNGTLIDEHLAARISEVAPQAAISVSLDGAKASTYEKMCGVAGSFEKAVKGIESLAKAGLKVRVAMQVTAFNFCEMENTLLLARRLGARWFGWSPVLPFGRGRDIAWDWDSSWVLKVAETEQRLREKYPDFIVTIEHEALKMNKDFGNCGLGYRHAVLSPSGKIRPCLFLSEDRFLGDAREEALELIFKHPDLALLKSLHSPEPEKCAPCKYTNYCAYCSLRPLTVFEREGRWCRWGYENLTKISLLRLDRVNYDASRPMFE